MTCETAPYINTELLLACAPSATVSVCTAGGKGQDQQILSKHGTWSLSSFQMYILNTLVPKSSKNQNLSVTATFTNLESRLFVHRIDGKEAKEVW